MKTSASSDRRFNQRAVISAFALIVFSVLGAAAIHARAVVDFDGDGKTDYAVVRHRFGSPGGDPKEWYVLLSGGGQIAEIFGFTTGTLIDDGAVPADYDGDGKWDIAIFRNIATEVLYFIASETNTLQSKALAEFGYPTMTQDYDGDGKADTAAVFPSPGPNYIWRIAESKSGNIRRVNFGRTQFDLPILGDFDGDGQADIAVYRTAQGTPANTFIVLRSSDGEVQYEIFGNSQTDDIVSADFDGDSKTDFAVWRGKGPNGDGVWYWKESSTGEFKSLHFGITDRDRAATGDYDGDGKTDHAIVRYDTEATDGRLIVYVYQSTGGVTAKHWGNGWDWFIPTYFARR